MITGRRVFFFCLAIVSERDTLDRMAEELLEELISLRLSVADKQLLDRLAERLPLKSRAIARIAMRIGLIEIDRDPSRIFSETATETKKPKRTPARK